MNKKSAKAVAKIALRLPWVISLGLHGLVVLVLLFTVRCDPNSSTAQHPASKPIKATVINETLIRAKKEKKRQQQLAKKRKEQQRLERIRQEKLKKKRLAEKKRLEAKKKKDVIKKKKIAAENAKKARLRKAKRDKAQQEKIKKQRVEQQRQLDQKRLAKQRDQANAKAVTEFKAKARKERQAEEKRLQDELMRSEQANINQAKETQRQTTINEYEARLRKKINRYWNRPKNIRNGLSCRLEVRLIPGGDVLDVKITRSSGNAIFDRSAINAVNKASPLPIPNDINLFNQFKIITYDFSPDE